MNCGAAERGRSVAQRDPHPTSRPDGDCPGGSSQSARGWKGGGRADRAKLLPRCSCRDHMASDAYWSPVGAIRFKRRPKNLYLEFHTVRRKMGPVANAGSQSCVEEK